MNRPRLDTLFLSYRASGDASALAQVFDLAAPELYELARRLSPDRAAAEDVLQDTFVAAIEKRASWDEREPLLPWLIGILAIASQRRRRERARTPDPERVTQTPVERPDDVVAAGELRRDLEATLAALKPEERSLVEERLLEGRTPRDMARERGLSATTLRMRLSRALTRLRRAAPSSLSWALLPSWTARKAVHSVRMRLLPGLPSAAPALAPLVLAVSLLGIAAVAGTVGIVACLSPEEPKALAAGQQPAQLEPLASSQPHAQLESAPVAKGAPAAEGATGTSERTSVPPEPKLLTLGPPPAEGEFAAPAPTPDMPRKRLHLLVTRNGSPLADAGLLRVFSDGGYEGLNGRSDALGRLDVDIIVAQPTQQLFIEARACKKAYFQVDPAQLVDGETRTIELVAGPEPVSVRFVAEHRFPKGFVVIFIALGQLGDRRPEPEELVRDFLVAFNHPDSAIATLRPDGTTEVPILPGAYWAYARAGHNGVSSESLDLVPCCFEVSIPEGRDCEIPYAGSVGGSLVLDVLGPATIGKDVSVTLEDAAGEPRKLWFRTYGDERSAAYSTQINVGTPGARSEAIPAGEHTLVFTQRGKEIDRRKVTIVRGKELKLSIKP